MKTFEFVLPTHIRFGDGVSADIAAEVKRMGNKRPMLVTDKGLMEAGIADKIMSKLDDEGIGYVLFDKIQPNPRDTTVHEAYELAVRESVDMLIAVGGGSSIDTAKGIGILMSYGGRIHDYEGLDKVPGDICDIIAIPTTVGTGSEVTFWSVITDTERHYKMSIGSTKIAPTLALVDPQLVETLPPAIIAATGMDALTHAIEGYTCRLSEPVTDACGIYAIGLIGRNIRKAVYTDDKEAKANMLLGSLIAGICFGNADIGGVHCMGEALGGVYDMPHGVAMAMLLPYVMEYNCPACIEKFAEVAKALGVSQNGMSADDLAHEAARAVHKMNRDLGIPTLRESGVLEEDLQELSRRASVNVSVESNPRKTTEEDFYRIFRYAYK